MKNFSLYIEIWVEILRIFCFLEIFVIGYVNVWVSWFGPEIGWVGGRGSGRKWAGLGCDWNQIFTNRVAPLLTTRMVWIPGTPRFPHLPLLHVDVDVP